MAIREKIERQFEISKKLNLNNFNLLVKISNCNIEQRLCLLITVVGDVRSNAVIPYKNKHLKYAARSVLKAILPEKKHAIKREKVSGNILIAILSRKIQQYFNKKN